MALGSGQLGSIDYSGMGLGGPGDLLGSQVQDETEEMKRRKALLQQMQEAVSPLGATSTLGIVGGGARRSPFGGFGFRANRGG
jgi:hypothetical protein